jgi:hypothetical protein
MAIDGRVGQKYPGGYTALIHEVDQRVHQSGGTDWDPVEGSEAGRVDQAGNQEGFGGP